MLSECEVGPSKATLSIRWKALEEKSSLLESVTGEVQIELVNNAASAVSVVPVMQVQQHGTIGHEELPVITIAGSTTAVVKFSLAGSAAAHPDPVAPATLLAGVRITDGAEPGVLWGPVSYAHMNDDTLLVYREGRLHSDFGNGDLSGMLAKYGLPDTTQLVDGGAGFAN